MNLRCLRPALRLACVAVAALFSALTLLPTALAQQITYYDFNVPASAQAPYASCTPSAATPLVCLNNNPSLPNSAGPTYATTAYPAAIDPNQQDVPPVASSNQAVQLTQPAASQGGSLWFRAPQKVADGFTAYFTFQITPSPYSSNTADGIAFVIQNALGNGASGTPGQDDYCPENGAGVTVTGNNGGCIGYGGIDNSVAFEFDTYSNAWDPFALGAGSFNDNHLAIMSCGASPNSPVHTGNCQVYLNAGTNAQQEALVNNPSGVRLADGNIHQVVITYNGPNEANPNLVQVFIDPVFVAGTHTPVAGSVPALSGVYNLTGNLNLINSSTGNNAPSLDSAYVGFTSSTGASYEQHTLLNWTFTPHTPVTLTEPLQTNGTTTVFPFGAHTYGVTYPTTVNTSGISMTVTANPISQTLFTQLINAGPFAGSQCQIYDETGGNCIVYSVSCVTTATGAPVMCPAATAADPITIKSAYNDSIVAVTPGFIQGDPFYSQVMSISGDGVTATVDCLGECAVTAGQTVTLAGAVSGGNPSAFNGTVTVVATPSPNVFTFASTVSGSATGGYLTSTNVQNIFFQQLPYRLDATTTGKTKNFSDFVVTGVTTAPTKLSICGSSGGVWRADAGDGHGDVRQWDAYGECGVGRGWRNTGYAAAGSGHNGVYAERAGCRYTYLVGYVWADGDVPGGNVDGERDGAAAGGSGYGVAVEPELRDAVSRAGKYQDSDADEYGDCAADGVDTVYPGCGQWRFEGVYCAEPVSEDAGGGGFVQGVCDVPGGTCVHAADGGAEGDG